MLKEKIKYANGRTLRKAYEKPKTPYQRLIESGYLDEAKKEELNRISERLD